MEDSYQVGTVRFVDSRLAVTDCNLMGGTPTPSNILDTTSSERQKHAQAGSNDIQTSLIRLCLKCPTAITWNRYMHVQGIDDRKWCFGI